MKRYLARIVQNAHEAEELAQETFVRLYQKRERFREGARFSPWLYAIAANLARNRLRWWRRRPAVSLEAWTEFGGEAADESSAGHAASGALEQRECAEAVRAAVAALPVELRSASHRRRWKCASTAPAPRCGTGCNAGWLEPRAATPKFVNYWLTFPGWAAHRFSAHRRLWP
jgi:RNA polymerase sigma factor (sigma-70 family)